MKKVYEVIIGYREIKTGEESFNCDSFTIIATDVFHALSGDYLIDKEKLLKKDGLLPFIQEVKMIKEIDFEEPRY